MSAVCARCGGPTQVVAEGLCHRDTCASIRAASDAVATHTWPIPEGMDLDLADRQARRQWDASPLVEPRPAVVVSHDPPTITLTGRYRRVRKPTPV